jgi:sterol desaturase/sphingolipid hydroxylase (fatty acid hydroxylase superfamily)
MDSLLKVTVVSIFAEQAGGGPRFWPGDAPLLLQLVLALLVTQFFEYWWHRLSHEHPILWRLHATHHSPQRLYWLNAGRFHPLDTVGSVSVSLLVVICLGAEGDLVVMLGIWVAVHGLYQHCNVDLRLGPLNYIFSMAELHRWHHSRVLEEANANYGNNIILWDLVFGTFYWPQDRQPSSHIGLSDHPNFPTEYWGQVMSPFRWHSSRHDGSQEDSSTGGPSS